MYTIDEKNLKNNQQIKGKAPKRQGGHASCPKPKNMYTCTQYKKKKSTNKQKQGMRQTMPHVYKMSKHPKDKGY
jgi:hypothetical protein